MKSLTEIDNEPITESMSDVTLFPNIGAAANLASARGARRFYGFGSGEEPL